MKMEDNISVEMENQNKSQNLTLAIVLSLLVALGGAIVWGVCYYFGFLASIISFVTSFCMILVYKKFYEVDKKAYIYVAVSTIVLNLVACFFALVVTVMVYGECGFGVALGYLGEIVPGLIGELIFDIILSIAFTIVGVVVYKKIDERKQQEALAKQQILENAEQTEQVEVSEQVQNDSQENQEKTE